MLSRSHLIQSAGHMESLLDFVSCPHPARLAHRRPNRLRPSFPASTALPFQRELAILSGPRRKCVDMDVEIELALLGLSFAKDTHGSRLTSNTLASDNACPMQ